MLEDGSHSLMYLYSMDAHCCGQETLGVIKQDFKNNVKKIMSEDPRAKFGKVNIKLHIDININTPF